MNNNPFLPLLPYPPNTLASRVSRYLYINTQRVIVSPGVCKYPHDICYAKCYAKHMKCLNCNANFEPKRNTAKYCSDKCRVYHTRGITVTVPALAEIAPKIITKKTPVPIPEILGGPPDPNVRWNKLCEHFAGPKLCKKPKCLNYQFRYK